VRSLAGPIVALDGRDCAQLGRALVQAIDLAYTSRGTSPPAVLLEFSNRVNALNRAFPFREFPADAQVRPTCETAKPGDWRFSQVSDQPVMLTATEAARIAEVSVQYMRAICRRGDDLQASRGGHQGAWLIDADDLAVWISRRREVTEQEAG
jgi:hypothetical protein